MATARRPRPGAIAWVDLTVKDAGRLRDFCAAVAALIEPPR